MLRTILSILTAYFYDITMKKLKKKTSSFGKWTNYNTIIAR
jgi:hypothetical protein